MPFSWLLSRISLGQVLCALSLLGIFNPLTTVAEPILPEQYRHQPHLVFSYVKHDYVESIAIPIIERAYKQLGISIVFVEMPSHREMLEVSKGKIDGSVIASKSLYGRYSNILTVQPAITQSVFVLMCIRHIPCDKQVLADSNAHVVMTDASEKALRYVVPDFSTQVTNINLLGAIPELISSGKFLYGIYVMEQSEIRHIQHGPVVYSELFRNPAHHVLAKKHESLIPAISTVLKTQLSLSSAAK
ncbi:MAG: hypothetical protein ACFHVJ_19855 [Aestuariibacter sp.]